MVDLARAERVAEAWIAGWNAHDIEAVLALYGEDAEQVSPLAARLLGGPIVRGKDALREYFRTGLRRSPDLRFELIDVFAGVSSITIVYHNHRQQRVAETLVLDDSGKIVQVLVAHRPA